MLPYQQAFGMGFKLGITIPDCFEDRSYKNDVCPCFVHLSSDGRAWVLWIDYENVQDRELVGSLRYTLEYHLGEQCVCLLAETDSPEEINTFLCTNVQVQDKHADY